MAFWKKNKPAEKTATTTAASPTPTPAPAVSQREPVVPPARVAPSMAPQAPPQASARPNPPQPGVPPPQQPTNTGPPPQQSTNTAPAGRGSTGAGLGSITSPIAASLGKVVSVLMFSRRFQGMSLRELGNIVLPPVMANQYLVAEVREPGADITKPVGVLLWAQLSNELDQKLIAQNGSNTVLSGNEWKSGNNLWIIETVGQPEIVKAMITQLVEGAFKGKPFKFPTRSADGTASIEEFDPAVLAGPGP